MKKVSLIIPVYNAEKYLKRCLESVVMQTYKNLEIICINDESNDRSGEIAEEFAKMDNRIIVIHQKNAGESGARNTGLMAASGDYIGFIDCDDWIELEMYERLVKLLESQKADMAAASWFLEREEETIPIRNEKEVKLGSFDREQLMEYLYERDSYRGFAYMWDKLYRRELIFDSCAKPMLFHESLILGGDVLYLAQLALKTNKAAYMDVPFYHYFQRMDSGGHTSDLEKKKDWLQAYLMIIDLYSRNKISCYILDLLKRFLVYHSGNIATEAFGQKNGEMLRYCKNIMLQYKNEYLKMNEHKPERMVWFEKILEYEV